jgi:hypothetical protein
MKKEKAIIRLNLLFDRLMKCKKEAFMGVAADDENVKNLWPEFEEIRVCLIQIDPDVFKDLREVTIPEPSAAGSVSYYHPGTPIFHPKHFNSLETEMNKAIAYVELIKNDNSSRENNQLKGNIHISASEGSQVNVVLGDNNKVLQNTEQIDKRIEEIEELGVDKPDLEILKEIINQNASGKEDKISTGRKILGWAGSITKKVIEKGLTENIPSIVDKAQSLIDLI